MPKGTLAWGMSRPGKAPTSGQKALSPGVWLARGKHPLPVRPKSSVPAAHGNLPEDRPGLGGNSLHDYGIFPVHQRGGISLLPR